MIFLDNGGLVRKPGGEWRGNSPGPRVTGLTSQPSLGLTSPNAPPKDSPPVGDLAQASQKGEVGTMEGSGRGVSCAHHSLAPQRPAWGGGWGPGPFQRPGSPTWGLRSWDLQPPLLQVAPDYPFPKV